MNKISFFGSYQYCNQVIKHFVVFGDTYKEVYERLCKELDAEFLDIPADQSLPESEYLQWLYFDHRELNSDISFGYSIYMYKFVPGTDSSHVEQLVH